MNTINATGGSTTTGGWSELHKCVPVTVSSLPANSVTLSDPQLSQILGELREIRTLLAKLLEREAQQLAQGL